MQDIFFPSENVSTKNSFTQSGNISSDIQKGFGRLCSLYLVLWARPFYSWEKEEVQRMEKFTKQKGSGRLCSLWLVFWARPFYCPDYKDNLEKEKVYIEKLCHVSETLLSVH